MFAGVVRDVRDPSFAKAMEGGWSVVELN